MTRPFHTVYLGLGTNLGDREQNLRQAIMGLREWVRLTAVSPLYETEPWGMTDQPLFWNMCVAGETAETPGGLLAHCKQLEKEIGRTVAVRWGPRLIDIDILFYDDWVLHDEWLIIPHLQLAQRAFVLRPLVDIAPDLIHPESGLKTADMLKQVDTTGIRPLSVTLSLAQAGK
jgi:2-amino-4-hydroxy-6-hydroxymethyldihydropteridine diphosphokinase